MKVVSYWLFRLRMKRFNTACGYGSYLPKALCNATKKFNVSKYHVMKVLLLYISQPRFYIKLFIKARFIKQSLTKSFDLLFQTIFSLSRYWLCISSVGLTAVEPINFSYKKEIVRLKWIILLRLERLWKLYDSYTLHSFFVKKGLFKSHFIKWVTSQIFFFMIIKDFRLQIVLRNKVLSSRFKASDLGGGVALNEWRFYKTWFQ